MVIPCAIGLVLIPIKHRIISTLKALNAGKNNAHEDQFASWTSLDEHAIELGQ